MELLKGIDLSTVLSLVLGLVATFGGGYYLLFKKKFGAAIGLLKEVVLLLDSVEFSLQDGKLTKEEIELIKSKLINVREAYYKLINKTV